MRERTLDEMLLEAEETEADLSRKRLHQWQRNGLAVWRRERRKAIAHAVIDFALTVGLTMLAVYCLLYIIGH